jgi:hypothetical protein
MVSNENKFGEDLNDQDSDCWSELYRLIKANVSWFLRYFKSIRVVSK